MRSVSTFSLLLLAGLALAAPAEKRQALIEIDPTLNLDPSIGLPAELCIGIAVCNPVTVINASGRARAKAKAKRDETPVVFSPEQLEAMSEAVKCPGGHKSCPLSSGGYECVEAWEACQESTRRRILL